MSEFAISITWLNDFVFCPASIYYHGMEAGSERISYQSTDQLNGTAAHHTVDSETYSTSAHILQGMSVYSDKYDLIGKIDVFDTKTGLLRERKKKIKTVFDGYVFQTYAQYMALTEMGYRVKTIELYSMDDNKRYPIPLPYESPEMLSRFEEILREIKTFRLQDFVQTNREKCVHCIYEPMCPYSLNEECL